MRPDGGPRVPTADTAVSRTVARLRRVWVAGAAFAGLIVLSALGWVAWTRWALAGLERVGFDAPPSLAALDFLAGVGAFFAPCAFSLFPGYVSYSVDADRRRRWASYRRRAWPTLGGLRLGGAREGHVRILGHESCGLPPRGCGTCSLIPSVAVQVARQPERQLWPEPGEEQAHGLDRQERVHPAVDLVQRDMRRGDPLQIERSHRHRR
jgi:hypothetical protein